MKKFVLVLLIISLVSFMVFADPEVKGTGSLNVYGKIGEPDIDFTVSQTNSDARYDLLNNTDIQPDGDGVIIGKWIFSATNAASPVAYTVSYASTPLTSGSTTIPFAVYEFDEDDIDLEIEDDQSTFNATAGAYSLTRHVAVKLVNTVPPEAPSGSNYNGSITITLTTGN